MAVRVRNLSDRGALIDGRSLPPQGSLARLVRGSLDVGCEVVWRDGNLGGLRLEAPINVDQWVRRVGHEGQQRVDDLIATLRQPGAIPAVTSDAASADLAGIVTELEEICARLADYPEMKVEFAEELLKLDAIAQSLRRIPRA